MTNTILLIAVLVVGSLFVGFVVETYKKIVRDGKTSVVENRVVAFLLSLVMGFFVYEAVDLTQITSLIRDSIWVALLYGVCIYVLQYESSMKVWKPVVKRWVKNLGGNE